MTYREFWSKDPVFGMKLAEKDLRRILDTCTQSVSYETGGILVGCYTASQDCALVTAVSTAPSDSRKGRTWFHRGKDGLQDWLDHLWVNKRYYYLGEWHFHPSAQAFPSPVDIEQMQNIAISPLYCCPEPLLVLIGGNLLTTWETKVYIFPRGKTLMELSEQHCDKNLPL